MALPILLAGAASLGAYAIGATAITLGGLAGSFAIGAALSGLSLLLAPPQATPSQRQPRNQFPSTDSGAMFTGKESVDPRSVVYGQARVNGTVVFAAVSDYGVPNGMLHLVIALADHEVEAIDDIHANDMTLCAAGTTTGFDNTNNLDSFGHAAPGPNYAATTPVDPHVYVERYLGTASQAASSTLISYNVGWTAEHTLSGVAYIYVRLIWDRGIFAGGLPNIWAVVRGKKVFDPRSSTTAYSANAALCVADYLADARHGLGCIYGTEINNTQLSAAANICDETVTNPDNSTEPLYTCNGAFTCDQIPTDIVSGMLSAMLGRIVWVGGQWLIQPAVYVTPESEGLTEDDLRAPLSVQNLIGRRSNFDAVKGTYPNPKKNWQPDDFPSVPLTAPPTSVYEDIQLPFTNSPTMCERIGIMAARRNQFPKTIVFPAKLKGWRYTVGDIVPVTVVRRGWTNKLFEVLQATLAFDTSGGGGGGATPVVVGVDLTMRETDPSIYSIANTDLATPNPALKTSLPQIYVVKPPSNIRASESQFVALNGAGVQARWTISWDAAPDAFVQNGGSYLPQYRLVGAAAWTDLGPTTALTVNVDGIAPGTYEAQVFAVNYSGIKSPALYLAPTIVVGLSAAPAAPSNFTVAAMDSFALARCDLSEDLDVQIGGFILFRHSALASGATWDQAQSLCDPMPANAGAWSLPLKSGTYLAKFENSAGVMSTSATSFVQTQSSPQDFAALSGGLIEEDPSFAGVKTGCFVDGSGNLTLTSSALVSSIPLISAVTPSLGWYGTVLGSGTYAFANVMDLGSVHRCRLTNTVHSQVFRPRDLVSQRSGNVSSWPSVSGVTGDEADTYLQVASTQTDPHASPTWTAWQRLDASTFSARAFKFQRVLESFDPSASIKVSADSVIAEGV